VSARMQSPRSIARKEGEAAECLTAIRDTFHDRGDAGEQTGPDSGVDVESSKVKDEEQPNLGSRSGGLGSGVVMHSEGESEDAFTFDSDYSDNEGEEPNDGGEEPKVNVDDQDDSAALSIEATTSLHEHHDDPASSLRASEMPPSQSATATESSQTHSDTANASAEATDSLAER
jgi:hypothetical protein